MVDHDNAADGDPDAEAFGGQPTEPAGPRRSTWTPATDWRDADPESLSDDHLANVLAEDFERATHTGAFAVQDILDSERTPSGIHDQRVEPAAEHEVGDVDPAVSDEDEEEDYAVNSWLGRQDVPSPQAFSGETPSDEAPWHNDVSDETSSEETVPVVPVARPARHSMPTTELAATLAERADSGGNPDAIMATLEEQLNLRAQDAAEFARWQESMMADGSTAARAEVESARGDFGDIIDFPQATHPTSPSTSPEPSLATHTFRVDEVLDIELLRAPAPMSAPISDIPPPPVLTISPPVIPAPAIPVPVIPSAEIPDSPQFADVPTFAPEHTVQPEPEPEPEAEAEEQSEPELDVQRELEPELELEREVQSEPELISVPPAPIPDLVEPIETAAIVDPFDFDSIVGGTLSSVDEAPDLVAAVVAGDDVSDFGSGSGSAIDDDHDDYHGDDDDVAETDRVFADLIGPFPVTSEGVTILPEAPVQPFVPVASAQAPITAPPLVEVQPTAPPVFRVEETSVEPTLTDQRVGRASRLFWLWFAANSSIVSVAFGGAVLALGMSLRQAIVATLIGVAVSFLPLGLGTLAGKWSGQPTMIVSRATFGHIGNMLPAGLALVVRVFWGAVLLWFLAAGTARILKGAALTGPFSETQVAIIGLAVGFFLALVIAFFGYGLIARIQLTFTVISALLIVGLIVVTWPAVNIGTALTLGDGPWILVLTGAVLVFSFVGLVWAVSSADLARYQRPSGSGAASMLWSTFGATIPAFVLIAYGAVLAASNPEVAAGFLQTPLDTIALLFPVWYPIPLIAALVFSLLSGIVISIYSGGFALQATGASMRRPAAVVIVGAAVAVGAILIAVSVGDFTLILRDVATSLAVPIAAWAGIFGAEMMIRNRGFVAQSLLKRGGVYPDVNWVNLSMLVVASVVGFGFMTSTVAWLGWQGYFFTLFGVPLTGDLAASDLGVFVALVLGILTPIIVGIPGIRRQERGGVMRSNVAADS